MPLYVFSQAQNAKLCFGHLNQLILQKVRRLQIVFIVTQNLLLHGGGAGQILIHPYNGSRPTRVCGVPLKAQKFADGFYAVTGERPVGVGRDGFICFWMSRLSVVFS